ncbi:MAG: hypothetical protein NPIRA06_25750 [Nitrospirales bacterium]|nr:MAG: hypothetical protein NPIRA06_25750 [Nitrospirales bacterium]
MGGPGTTPIRKQLAKHVRTLCGKKSNMATIFGYLIVFSNLSKKGAFNAAMDLQYSRVNPG